MDRGAPRLLPLLCLVSLSLLLLLLAPSAAAQSVRTVNGALTMDVGNARLTLSTISSACSTPETPTSYVTQTDLNAALNTLSTTLIAQTQPQINNVFMVVNHTAGRYDALNSVQGSMAVTQATFAATLNNLASLSGLSSPVAALQLQVPLNQQTASAQVASLSTTAASQFSSLQQSTNNQVNTLNTSTTAQLSSLQQSFLTQLTAVQTSAATSLNLVQQGASTQAAANQQAASAQIAALQQSNSLALSLINTLQSSLSSTIVQLQSTSSSVTQERSRALVAEGSLALLQSSLNSSTSSETLRAAAAETSLAALLSSETSRASAAETLINANVTTLSITLPNTDRSLALSIASETSRALTADASLASSQSSISLALNQEISRATVADVSASNALLSEVSRALSVEYSLGIAVNRTTLSNGLSSVQAAASCLHIYTYFNSGSGVYWINPSSPFQVYCDMSDGGGWMKILALGASTLWYTPTAAAIGTIATATVTGAAKLSDANINYLFSATTGPVVYRLDSSITPAATRYVYIRTTARYTDTALANGITSTPGYVCQTSSLAVCGFYYDSSWVGGTGRIDTYDDRTYFNGAATSDDAHRIFWDYFGSQQCFGTSGTSPSGCTSGSCRCFSSTITGGTYMQISPFAIWVRQAVL